jgi:hypothetical protein
VLDGDIHNHHGGLLPERDVSEGGCAGDADPAGEGGEDRTASGFCVHIIILPWDCEIPA